MPESYTKLYSQAHRAAKMAKEYGADLPSFSGVEREAIVKPYARLPTTPEGSGEDIGLDFNPHLPPWPATSVVADSAADATELPILPDTPLASPAIVIAHRRAPSPLVLAVDAAADGQDLSRIPESPSDGRPSFDTLVRDLVQSRPDSPIGGHPAHPIAINPKRSFNVGTLVIKGTPRIEISCADTESYSAENLKKHTKSRSISSEPGAENLQPRSDTIPCTYINTPPMFTAPESPRSHSRTDGSDDGSDMDDRRLTISDVRDFGLASDGSRSKKASKVPEPAKIHESEPASTHPVPKSDPDYCEDCVSPRTKAPAKKEPPKTTTRMNDSDHAKDAKAGKDPEAVNPNRSLHLKDSDHGKDAKAGKDGKIGKPKDSDKKDGKSGKGGQTALAGVLTDATGQLSPPGTPKPKKRVVLKGKGQMAVRKCRGVVFRTPVLSVVVGRKLAPSTSHGLKMIAKGVDVKPPEVVPAPVSA
jgi:hypothetical protein